MAERDKQNKRQSKEPSFAEQEHKTAPFVAPQHENATWQPPSFVSNADQPQSAKEAEASHETAAPSQPIPQQEPPYDYAEDYYPNSATQSYLHDSYYPHLYYQDWHETEYDETDRAQDYYHDAAYDEQARYSEETYRDQEQYRQQDYYRDYDHSYDTPSYSNAANDTFAPSAFAAAGIVATGEAYAKYAANAESRADDSVWPSYAESANVSSAQVPDAGVASAYPVPETAYSLNTWSDYDASSPQDDQSRLIINRVESAPSTVSSYEDSRLTVNQPMNDYSPPAYTQEAMAASLINSYSDAPASNDANRFTVHQTENSAIPTPTLQTESFTVPTAMDAYSSQGVPLPLQDSASHISQPAVDTVYSSNAYGLETMMASAAETRADALTSTDTSRLIINREEDARLTVNQTINDYPSPTYAPEMMADALTTSTQAHAQMEQGSLQAPHAGYDHASTMNDRAEQLGVSLPTNDSSVVDSMLSTTSVSDQRDAFIFTPEAAAATIINDNPAPEVVNASTTTYHDSILSANPSLVSERTSDIPVVHSDDASRFTVNQPMSDYPSPAQTHERMGEESLQPLYAGYDHAPVMSDRAERADAVLHANESTVVDSMLSTTGMSDQQESGIPITHSDELNRLTVNQEGEIPAAINELENSRLMVNRPEDMLEASITHPSTTPEENLHSVLSHTDTSVESAVARVPHVQSNESILAEETDWPLRSSEPLYAESSIVQATIDQLAWHERTVEDANVYQANIGAAQLLIRDKGPGEEEGRFGWSLMETGESEPVCLLKGKSDSLQSAETELVIQAHQHGLIGNLQTESLLVQSSSPKEKAAEYVLQTHADIQEEKKLFQDGILSDAQEDGLLEPSLTKVVKSENAKEHAALAGTAALGVLGFAGQTALKAGQAARQTASRLATITTHEDEEFGKMDDARVLVEEAVAKELPKHRARKQKDLLREAKLTAADQLINHDSDGIAHDSATRGQATTVAHVGVRDKDMAADAKQLLEKRQAERVLAKEKDGVEEGLIHSKAKVAKHSLSKEEVAEAQLLNKREKGPKDKGKDKKSQPEKKPVTKRERDLAKKKEKLADAKLDKSSKALTMLSPVQSVKRGALAGAGIAKNITTSSVSKVLTKENEDLATLASMTDNTKRAVRDVRKVARIPQRTIQTVRQTAEFLRNLGAMIGHAIAGIFSLGWPFILMLVFMLIMVAVVVASTLSVWNENQETSEVSALVAKLDEDLEAKIHSYGHRGEDNLTIPIYYCDARGTYNTFDENDHDLTKDVDLKDDASDLETVDAASVEVFTNPDDIIAYIDAKYEGEWQVGAASWKVTVDWDGKTYNIFDWEKVPEFVQRGLNEVDQVKFEGALADTIGAYLVDEFYGGYDKMTPEEAEEARKMAETIAEELGNVIYDQQLQGVTDEVVYEAIRAGIKQHKSEMDLSDDQLTTLNYEIMAVVTELVGEQEPVALVYDEIVELHKLLNYWSEDYEHIDTTQTAGGGVGGGGGSGASNTSNAYGYPNSSGYDPDELAKWDGYNEVSVYGISEPGTTSITADGTRITNDWSDTNMAIACEGLQNAYFAYWTSAYKQLHDNADQPVRITLYNPETGATVTAEVRDCGGWRGFNPKYAGMNATRQWDLLPAVWKALGGTESSGLMNVYWKVDNEATVTGAVPGMAAAEVVIGEYPWEKETDNIDGNLTVNRATYIRHDVQDLMHNIPLLEKIVGRDNFASDSEFYAVIDFVTAKLKDIMKPVLTMENVNGNSFTDYMMTRRELGDPFGKAGDGSAAQWVITERFNPGFEDSFDRDKVSVGIKPLNGDFSVYAVKKGTVSEIDGNKVVVSIEVDTNSTEYFVYENVTNIQVSVGDEVKSGTKIGTLADQNGSLLVSWYECFIDQYDLEWQRSWAYNPSLFMQGFAGYAEPDSPTTYVGGSARSLEDCETIVDFAYSRLGCPYVWGATGPDTFDCSGLTQWCYAQAGISIPRTSEAQHDAAAAAGNIIPLDESQLQPGDILWKSGHVGIYIGNNQYIHAPQTGDVVKISTGISYFECALRFGS